MWLIKVIILALSVTVTTSVPHSLLSSKKLMIKALSGSFRLLITHDLEDFNLMLNQLESSIQALDKIAHKIPKKASEYSIIIGRSKDLMNSKAKIIELQWP